jgi:hypothetical protein
MKLIDVGPFTLVANGLVGHSLDFYAARLTKPIRTRTKRGSRLRGIVRTIGCLGFSIGWQIEDRRPWFHIYYSSGIIRVHELPHRSIKWIHRSIQRAKEKLDARHTR